MGYDVAIIGAGAAGLAAARAISGAGLRTCVVEARERTGGRIRTLRLPRLPIPIELGAEFVHGSSSSTFAIIDAAALATAELPDSHYWSETGRWRIVRDFWGEIGRVQKRIGSLRRDVSFEAFLRSRRGPTGRVAKLAREFVEGYHAAHADRISAMTLASSDEEQSEEEEGGNRQFRIAAGQDGIISWLEAGVDPLSSDLHLGTAVTTVRWRQGYVELECQSALRNNGFRLRAKAAVITIPIGVWKATREQTGAIVFEPPLQEKIRALDLIESAHVVKILFQFKEPFWDSPAFVRDRVGTTSEVRAPLNFVHSADRYVPTWWSSAPVRSPILTGWAGGHAADLLRAEGSDGMVDRALDSFSRTWGISRREIDDLLVGTFTHDWQSDPFSRCAYSYAAVGGANAAASLARPMRKTLFFAGEATSSDQTGTVAGAVDSGNRAAREVLRVLAPRRSR